MGPKRGGGLILQDSTPSFEGTAKARASPISPSVTNQPEYVTQREFLIGATESDCTPASEEGARETSANVSPGGPLATDCDDEEAEEGRVPRSRKFPDSMSVEELRVHSLTHIPFHPGCKCCVAGRKRDHKHPRRRDGQVNVQADPDESTGASICADYFFPRDRPGEEGLTALAVGDVKSQFLAAHVVDSKGAGAEHAIKQVLRDLRKMGHYGDLKVRMVQESALSDLFRAVGKERGDARAVLTHAARSDSKGNGQAEKVVQSIEEMVRTLFIDLEQRCGEELSVHDDFFPWLLEHACDLLNRFKVRKGNRTAWEYLTGEPYTGEVYAFGTPVMHRISGPVQGGVISDRWFDGIWIGLQFSSGEHIVATSDGRVIRARAVHPRLDTVKITR